MDASPEKLGDITISGDDVQGPVLSGVNSGDLEDFEGKIDVGDIELTDTTYARGLDRVEVNSVGSISVPLRSTENTYAVTDSEVNTVNGGLEGKFGLYNSDVNLVEGDSTFTYAFAHNSDNLVVRGDIVSADSPDLESQSTVFENSNLPTVVSENVQAGNLDSNSSGGLVVADNLNVNKKGGGMTAISPNPRRRRKFWKFPASEDEYGWEEWQRFKEGIEKNHDRLYGIPILNPDKVWPEEEDEARFAGRFKQGSSGNNAEEFIADFYAKEKYLQNILDEELDFDARESRDAIAERIGTIRAFNGLENRRYASLLNLAVQIDEEQAEGLEEFGDTIDGYWEMDEPAKQELLSRLDEDDIVELGSELRYDMMPTLNKELEELVTSKGDIPELDDLKEDWEEYEAWNRGFISLGSMLEKAYREEMLEEPYREETVANLAYIADILGEDLELDTEKWVAEQKKRKSEGKEYDIDSINDITEVLEEELEQKKQEMTINAIKSLREYDAIPVLGGEYGITPFLTSTKENKGFIEFTGNEDEWETFQSRLDSLDFNRHEKRGDNIYRPAQADDLSPEFFGIPILRPSIDTVSSWEEFEKIENEVQNDLYAEFSDIESDLDRVLDEAATVNRMDFLDTRYKSQILSKLVEDTANEDDWKASNVSQFNQTLRGMDEGCRDELFELLKTEKDLAVESREKNEHGHRAEYSSGDDKFGNTLFDIATNREYSYFIDNEVERIEELLEVEGSLPVIDPFFEEDSPYREVVEELISEDALENGEDSDYGAISDQELARKLRMATGLADRLDLEYDGSSVFGMLKGKEGQRKEGQRQNTDFEPNQEDIDGLLENRRQELEKDVESKLREYVSESIKKLGFDAAMNEYEEAVGSRKEELDENEISAIKVRKKYGSHFDKVEMVDKLLEHGNDIYETGANQDWLEKHDFTAEEIKDPEMSEYEDEDYSRPETADHRSALKVEIDPENIELDIEREKQQYWDEITGLLDTVGIEQGVEDIDDAVQALKEYEGDEDIDYKELKDVVNNYKSVENRAGGIPDELTIRVASPMDTTRMGQGFGSCHDIDGGSYAWASIANADDANKMVFMAEDEKGRDRARVKAFITEDEEMVYHNTSRYKDVDIDTSEYFEGYMERVADSLGLDLKHSSEIDGWDERVELLEANNWYSGD